MSNKVTNINEHNFNEIVLESSIPVFVDFWAPWCGPCRTLWPIIEQLAQEHSDVIKFVKVNVDEVPDLAMKYRISGIPNIKIIEDGDVIQDVTWVRDYTYYNEVIKNIIE